MPDVVEDSGGTGSFLRVGLAMPQIPDHEAAASRELLTYARDAEQVGFDSLWVSELTSTPILHPLALLAYTAAATTRVRLGVAVLLTALRAPYPLAAELATIDCLSAGRLDVGVGLGSRNPELYARHGLSTERRLRRYLDGLDVMCQLWTQEKVSFHNDWWNLDCVPAGPKPVQRPHPPLWFGARRGQALTRVVELGSGWIASGSAPPQEFAQALRIVHAQLAATGRDRATFTVAKRAYLHVTNDPGPARERARGWFAEHYGNRDLADQVCIVGDADECVSRLGELHRAGVDLLLLNPIFEERGQLERLASDVLPALQRNPATPQTAQS